MKLNILPVSLLVFACPFVFAKNYALVVGGASKEYGTVGEIESQKHEFANNVARIAYGLKKDNYEVTVLQDSVDINFQNTSTQNPAKKKKGAPEERPGIERSTAIQKKNEDMNSFMKSEFAAKSATQSNLLKAFEDLADKAKSGDKVEIILNMHGHRFCDDKQVDLENNRSDNLAINCEHRIGVINPETGLYEYIPTKLVEQFVKQLDAKGVHTNLVLQSCHSGAAQSLFSGLKNTCTVFLASADNVGYTCFPHDPAGDLSYTSTIDGINYRFLRNHLNAIKSHPILSKDPCVDAVSKHSQEKKIVGNSISELYWSARRHDLMPEEPTISSLLQFPQFTTGRFGAKFNTSDKSICSSEIVGHLEKVKTQLSQAQQIVFETLKKELDEGLEQYRKNISDQQEAIKADNAEQVKKLQSETEPLAQKVVSMERQLTDLAKEAFSKPDSSDPCQRPL